jgi:hypothetical protein
MFGEGNCAPLTFTRHTGLQSFTSYPADESGAAALALAYASLLPRI